jgi:cysteine-S-conjugate beta-lyase
MSSGRKGRRLRRAATEIVHAGRDPFAHHGFVNPPVYRGSTVLYKSMESYEKRDQKYVYGRRGTPTSEALETAVAGLEGAARAWLAPSGAAAIATALLAFAKAGDHILVADTVYLPTRKFCNDVLSRFGVDVTYYDPTIGGAIRELVRANTTVVYAESPGSQTFEVMDIPAIAAVTRDKGAWLMLDNSWATPLYYKSFAHGADVAIHAATKYIVGHADAMLGVITANERAASRMVSEAQTMGICAGTEEIFLGLRGFRTIEVRLERHWRSGLDMARWLQRRPEVSRVLHPALETDPGHTLWKRDYLGASGLFSVVLEPRPKSAVAAMLNDLELFGMGASWGGFESLVLPFDASHYRTATQWRPGGPTLRFHIGLEDIADLQEDLDAGFARLRAAA